MNAKMGLGLLLGLFLIAVSQFQGVHAGANIEIKLQNFTSENKEGTQHTYFHPYFKFCLDRPRDPSSISPCYYGSTVYSKYFLSSKFIDFNMDKHDIENPWLVYTSALADSTVLFVVDVRDHDYYFDDHMVTMGISLNGAYYPNQASDSWKDLKLSKDGFNMNFQFRVYCESGYDGAFCNNRYG